MEPARKITREASVCARRKFGGYKPETPKIVRVAKVKEKKSLETITEAFGEYISTVRDIGCYEDTYLQQKIAFLLLKNRRFSVKDLDVFLHIYEQEMAEREGWTRDKVAAFISGMINASKARNFKLGGIVLDFKDSLGVGNTKNVEIQGDVGVAAFSKMKSGVVLINGNAGNGLGWCMRGGKITVRGDLKVPRAHYYSVNTARDMVGGEIHLEGDIISPRGPTTARYLFESVKHGRIYHKGELIVDK